MDVVNFNRNNSSPKTNLENFSLKMNKFSYKLEPLGRKKNLLEVSFPNKSQLHDDCDSFNPKSRVLFKHVSKKEVFSPSKSLTNGGNRNHHRSKHGSSNDMEKMKNARDILSKHLKTHNSTISHCKKRRQNSMTPCITKTQHKIKDLCSRTVGKIPTGSYSTIQNSRKNNLYRHLKTAKNNSLKRNSEPKETSIKLVTENAPVMKRRKTKQNYFKSAFTNLNNNDCSQYKSPITLHNLSAHPKTNAISNIYPLGEEGFQKKKMFVNSIANSDTKSVLNKSLTKNATEIIDTGSLTNMLKSLRLQNIENGMNDDLVIVKIKNTGKRRCVPNNLKTRNKHNERKCQLKRKQPLRFKFQTPVEIISLQNYSETQPNLKNILQGEYFL